MGEYEPEDSRNVTQTDSRAPGEPPRTGPREDATRAKGKPSDPAGSKPMPQQQQKSQSQSQNGQSQSQAQAGNPRRNPEPRACGAMMRRVAQVRLARA